MLELSTSETSIVIPKMDMREWGILMSGSMVQASLRDVEPKTQTRRVVTVPRGSRGGTDVTQPCGDFWSPVLLDGALQWRANVEPVSTWPRIPVPCPYGKPGDQLWVREAWRAKPEYDAIPPRDIPQCSPVLYEATHGHWPVGQWGKYRHARFMCRWMSRIQLEVTGIRIERLQEISEEDALAEGIQAMRCPDCHLACYGLPGWGHDQLNPTAKGAYRYLWESINGVGSWDANPWVWAVAFKRIKP